MNSVRHGSSTTLFQTSTFETGLQVLFCFVKYINEREWSLKERIKYFAISLLEILPGNVKYGGDLTVSCFFDTWLAYIA